MRHLLSPTDAYFRFCPTGEAFAVALDDARESSLRQLSAGAEAYMDSAPVRAMVARLVVQLLPAVLSAAEREGGAS